MVQNMEIVKSKKKIEINTRAKIQKKRRIKMTFILFLLIIISVLNMWSAAFYAKPDNIRKHYIFIFIFVTLYILIGNIYTKKINYLILKNSRINAMYIFLPSVLIFTFMLVCARLNLPIVPKINGAYGWITIHGFSIQPAEILKIAFIINIANALNTNHKIESKLMWISGIYCSFILFQKDLGTVIHYVLIVLFMYFFTVKKDKKVLIKWILFGVLLGVVCLGIMYGIADDTSDYKLLRVKSYIDGLIWDNYSDSFGYQVKQSIYAYGHGGIFGKGWFGGYQKYTYLPEIHTDFICATYGEEWGICGMIVLMILYIYLYKLIIDTALDSKIKFGQYLAIGLAGQFIIQVFINIFVEIGLLPVFGLPLPILSYGGSMMVSMGILFGIILNMNHEK